MSPAMKRVMHIGTLLAMVVGAVSLLAIVFWGGAWMGRTDTKLETISAAVLSINSGNAKVEERFDDIDQRMATDDIKLERQSGRISTLEGFHHRNGS